MTSVSNVTPGHAKVRTPNRMAQRPRSRISHQFLAKPARIGREMMSHRSIHLSVMVASPSVVQVALNGCRSLSGAFALPDFLDIPFEEIVEQGADDGDSTEPGDSLPARRDRRFDDVGRELERKT